MRVNGCTDEGHTLRGSRPVTAYQGTHGAWRVDAVGRQPERGPQSLHKSSKGLDLPLAGEPAPHIEAAPAVTRVAVLGLDTHGLKPTMLVAPGDRVALGQPLFEDKKNPGVRHVAPGAGRVVELHRGERRALISVVIELDGGSEPRLPFARYTGRPVAALGDEDVRALLLEAGLWDAFRTRPFSRTPKVDARPQAIFVTATDTRPHAPPPALVLAERLDDFARGMAAVAKLSGGPVFLCQSGDAHYDVPSGAQVVRFEGPHPSGNARRSDPAVAASHGWVVRVRLHPRPRACVFAHDEARHAVPECLETWAVEAASGHEPVDVRRITRCVPKVTEHIEVVGDGGVENIPPGLRACRHKDDDGKP